MLATSITPWLRAIELSRRSFVSRLFQPVLNIPAIQNYLAGGGVDLTQRNRRMGDIIDACILLGIDRQRVTDDARMLHSLLYNAGTPGRDFL